MPPKGWHQEHNVLHHYRLGETSDPDLVEEVIWPLRHPNTPMALRYLGVAASAILWKPLYYAPKTMRAASRIKPHEGARVDPWKDWLPFKPVGLRLWTTSWIPYVLLEFVLLPLLFLPLGTWAWMSVLINRICAEALTNAYSFFIIAPNHAGHDIWRFDGKYKDKTEFYLRQIVGSTNYPPGTQAHDLLHGFLNYQIEHHLFPTATPLQYRAMQPAVQALCERHGLPYRAQSVFKRFRSLVAIMVGRQSMRRLKEGASTEGAILASRNA